MKLQLSIDRFEGKLAVLLTDDGRQVNFPRDLLPAGCQAGDVLTLSIDRDQAATQKLQADTAKLQSKLKAKDPGGDLTL